MRNKWDSYLKETLKILLVYEGLSQRMLYSRGLLYARQAVNVVSPRDPVMANVHLGREKKNQMKHQLISSADYP